jgi:TetR/AcrR family transcriptional regulator, cholesterol catabolism regulator
VAINTLTQRQAARREGIIRAALELAAEGGYEAVHMRDVAARADVALGTIYHYFSSKDHLLAAVLVQWASDLERRLDRRPPEGDTVLDRVLDLLRRTTSGMRRYELLSAAIITGFTSPGSDVAACQFEVHEVWSRYMGAAFGDDVEPERRAAIIRTLEHVWYSGLIGWTFEWMSLDQAVDELETAARLLLDETR